MSEEEKQPNLEERTSGFSMSHCPHDRGTEMYTEKNCPLRIYGPGSKSQHIDCGNCPDKRSYRFT